MEIKPWVHEREFLNKPDHHQLSAIKSDVVIYTTLNRKTTKGIPIDIGSSLLITDCYKAITIDLDVYDEEYLSNSLEKISKIHKHVSRLLEIFTVIVENIDEIKNLSKDIEDDDEFLKKVKEICNF